MDAPTLPVLKDVVLLGGGHSHVEVLRSFGMKPLPGVRITLITKDIHTAYSGMLPGFVAGFYTFDECHIDLATLACFAGARMIHAEAQGIDAKAQSIQFDDRPPVRYDVLSIDVGITPSTQGVPGVMEHAIPVKPVSSFVVRLQKLRQEMQKLDRPITVAVVGGGAGGVELALAVHTALQTKSASERPADHYPVHAGLYTRGKVLAAYPASVRNAFLRAFERKGMQLHEDAHVTELRHRQLRLEGQKPHEFDACLWCTQASAPSWLRTSSHGLPLDDEGFVRVNDNLQCESGPANVFAVGDVSSSVSNPRPKAGVFAVRQGPPLANNLRRLLQGEELQPFTPQSTYLSIITTGERYAVATKSFLCLEGAWLWRVKDWIDRGWMAKYAEKLPVMKAEAIASPVAQAAGPEALAAVASARMRCSGCGAKVGSSVLSRALKRLSTPEHEHVLVGLGSPDDAALIQPPPPGHALVQTVDFLRSFVDDPLVFGAIAANHSLGDCHAMGATAQTALAVAVVPHGLDAQVEEDLYQMLAGALPVLSAAGCALVGGHTSEGAELALGFAINGSVQPEKALRKMGLQPGQILVLTKPLGTGMLLAAHMRRLAKGRWLQGAIDTMRQSNEAAAGCLQQHGASACTDVTGFGLLGHILEMAQASQVQVEVQAANLPILEGIQQCLQAGVTSSLHAQNSRIVSAMADVEQAAQHALWPLLCDPQTGGGLLAGVHPEQAEECISQLHLLGYGHACIVGIVQQSHDQQITTPFVALAGSGNLFRP